MTNAQIQTPRIVPVAGGGTGIGHAAEGEIATGGIGAATAGARTEGRDPLVVEAAESPDAARALLDGPATR